jgi:TonB family protein
LTAIESIPGVRGVSLKRIELIAVLVLAAIAPKAPGQDAVQGAVPNDPKALLAIGFEKNGLRGPDVQPWHIRGHYTIYDKDGKADDQGVYEERWVSATRYERSFTSAKFNQTEYASGSGLFRTGMQEWPMAELAMRSSLVEPVPEFPPEVFLFKMNSESSGKVKLACVSATYPVRENLTVLSSFFPNLCFDRSMPLLRVVSMGGGSRTVYNQIVLFQGHYLAHDLHRAIGATAGFDLSLDVVETMGQVLDSFPIVPSIAKPVDLTTIAFPPEVLRFGAVQLLRKAVPVYPQAAKYSGVQGTVVVSATIEKDGHVDQISVVSGPIELQQAAIDAVKQWLYQPFDVLDEPRAVGVQIKVIFTLG